jgi:hypothetical protein
MRVRFAHSVDNGVVEESQEEIAHTMSRLLGYFQDSNVIDWDHLDTENVYKYVCHKNRALRKASAIAEAYPTAANLEAAHKEADALVLAITMMLANLRQGVEE